MADELSEHKFQLQQVEEVLAKDPDNQELLQLKSDLTELINLLSATAQPVSKPKQEKPKTAQVTQSLQKESTTTSSSSWSVGQAVKAKYSLDGVLYDATITSVDASSETVVVTFTGYGNSEVVRMTDLQTMDNNKKRSRNEQDNHQPSVYVPPTAQGVLLPGISVNQTGGLTMAPKGKETIESLIQVGSSRGVVSKDGKDKGKEKEKDAGKDGQPKAKKPKSEEPSHRQKQQAWLDFASGKKGGKKMKVVPLKQKSMFSTPDDPMAKVGVIGSGKGMTQFADRKKWEFGEKK